jgi:hypothetical protein
LTLADILARSRSPLYWVVALLCVIPGLALAWQHPLWPTVALTLFYLWVVAVAWRPWLWLFCVPACLPFLNFWPWTGWQAFDEFDLLLLGALAGGYARRRLQRGDARVAPSADSDARRFRWLMLILIVATAISLLRGLVSAGLFDDGVDASFIASQAQTYESVWNVLRIAKSFFFALLFAPLLASEMQTEAARLRAQRLFASGMLVGLTLVTLVALWERAAYPGWLEFSTRYRTTALFWEMHVGGAAIDAYLVIATPFLGWALWSTRRPVVWAALAVLAILTCYAVLTTFSRGVYLAVLGPLIGMAVAAMARRRGFNLRGASASAAARIGGLGWRGRAGLILALLLVSEVLGVVLGGTFMAERLASAQDDLDSRVEHWARGINLLETPLDWAFGKGLGRLPALYSHISPETEFSGSVRLTPRSTAAAPQSPQSPYHITLTGPESNPELGGLFSLTQQVDFSTISSYTVSLRTRAETEADVRLKICEKHLIYEVNCHYRFVKIRPLPDGQWQALTIPLRGRTQARHASPLPRFGVFSVSVINAGGALAVQKIGIVDPGGKDILQNSDFSNGLSSWFSSSQSYYLPWHIDNVYLELLIERGLAALILMAAWGLIALNTLNASGALAQSPSGGQNLARYVAAALLGAATIGLVSSWMDVPRIAFLVFVLLFFLMQMSRNLPHNGETQ